MYLPCFTTSLDSSGGASSSPCLLGKVGRYLTFAFPYFRRVRACRTLASKCGWGSGADQRRRCCSLHHSSQCFFLSWSDSDSGDRPYPQATRLLPFHVVPCPLGPAKLAMARFKFDLHALSFASRGWKLVTTSHSLLTSSPLNTAPTN